MAPTLDETDVPAVTTEAGPEKGPACSFSEGDRVRVVRGAFSGRYGTVAGLDERKGVLVQLGSVTVQLAFRDVAPAIRQRRPTLGSSHRRRRPMLGRSRE